MHSCGSEYYDAGKSVQKRIDTFRKGYNNIIIMLTHTRVVSPSELVQKVTDRHTWRTAQKKSPLQGVASKAYFPSSTGKVRSTLGYCFLVTYLLMIVSPSSVLLMIQGFQDNVCSSYVSIYIVGVLFIVSMRIRLCALVAAVINRVQHYVRTVIR